MNTEELQEVTKKKVASEQEDNTQDKTQSTTNCCTNYCSKGKRTCLRFVYTDPYFKKWADKSTIHGVDHVFIGQSCIRRSLWLLVFLGALGGCFYGIVDRSIIFSRRPTATTVTVKENENGLPFPAVTICNLNPVQKSYADEHNISDTLRFLFNADLALLSGLPDSFRQEECYNILNKTKGVQSELTIYDIYKEGVISPKMFIQSCIFGSFRNDCRDDFDLVLTTSGPCYTFNGYKSESDSYNNEFDMMVRSTGFRFGLRMILNIEQSDYIQSGNGDAGIKVVLHNRSEVPDPDASGIAISPGKHAYIAMYPEQLVSRPELLECASENTHLQFFPQKKYSLSACRMNEYYKRSLEICGCTDIAEFPVSTQNCTLNSSCCLAETLMTTEQALKCLPGCDEFVYKPSVSYSKYPFDVNQTSEMIENNILALNVYFGSLHTTVSKTEFIYGFTALASDIGGVFALFIGASIISLIEIIFLFFDEIKRIFCPRKVRTAIEKLDSKVHNAIAIDNIHDNKDNVNGVVNTTTL